MKDQDGVPGFFVLFLVIRDSLFVIRQRFCVSRGMCVSLERDSKNWHLASFLGFGVLGGFETLP
jgi:hypothetical protein